MSTASAREGGRRIRLGRLMQRPGVPQPGFMLLLLAASCLMPVPGVATAAALGMAALAWGMGRSPGPARMPERLARLELHRIDALRLHRLARRFRHAAGRLARRRLEAVAALAARSGVGPLVAPMALLILLPIPFGNITPALAVMLLGVGLMFDDGLLVLIAGLCALASVLLVAALAVGAVAGLGRI